MSEWPPVCCACGGPATCAIPMSVPVRPYIADHYFCDPHGDGIQAIMKDAKRRPLALASE